MASSAAGGGGGSAGKGDGGAAPVVARGGGSSWPHQGHRLWASLPIAFWVYVYKVEYCPYTKNHDWKRCPFAHSAERARRRDLRVHQYMPLTCPSYRSSHENTLAQCLRHEPTCVLGAACRYAHGVFETWMHPTRFRTRMCSAGLRCPRTVCFFAHTRVQLRREDEVVPVTDLELMPPLSFLEPPPSSPPPRRRHRVSAAAPAASAAASRFPRPGTVLQTRSGQRIPLLMPPPAAGIHDVHGAYYSPFPSPNTAAAAAVTDMPAPVDNNYGSNNSVVVGRICSSRHHPSGQEDPAYNGYSWSRSGFIPNVDNGSAGFFGGGSSRRPSGEEDPAYNGYWSRSGFIQNVDNNGSGYFGGGSGRRPAGEDDSYNEYWSRLGLILNDNISSGFFGGSSSRRPAGEEDPHNDRSRSVSILNVDNGSGFFGGGSSSRRPAGEDDDDTDWSRLGLILNDNINGSGFFGGGGSRRPAVVEDDTHNDGSRSGSIPNVDNGSGYFGKGSSSRRPAGGEDDDPDWSRLGIIPDGDNGSAGFIVGGGSSRRRRPDDDVKDPAADDDDDNLSRQLGFIINKNGSCSLGRDNISRRPDDEDPDDDNFPHKLVGSILDMLGLDW